MCHCVCAVEYYVSERVNYSYGKVCLNFAVLIYFEGFCRSAAINITVDTDGLIQASGRGWKAGEGPSPGLSSDSGGSGGAHGGLGGRGTHTSHSQGAYDDTRHPGGAGSGGSVVSVPLSVELPALL